MLPHTLLFVCGLAMAAVPLNLVVVYLMKDVDAGVPSAYQAFRGLMMETFIFAVIAGVIFAVTTGVLRRVFGVADLSITEKAPLWLGSALIGFQFLVSTMSRYVFRNLELFEQMLMVVLLAGPAVCGVILVWFARKLAERGGRQASAGLP